MSDARKTVEKAAEKGSAAEGFTAEERSAMKERARELKGSAGRGRASKADGESDVLAKIVEMSESGRVIAERIHAIVKTAAPELKPKTWYGMPAYADQAGKVVCFFQNAGKFKARYGTLGFNDAARLDGGVMWPTSFAVTELSGDADKRIADLVARAAG